MDVTQVLGENIVKPAAPLAVTGTDLGWRSLIGLLLLLGGVALRVIRRRDRRSEA
jgi:LPXTG-motif cell wall-anchored protein